jgi:hypothetical protein
MQLAVAQEMDVTAAAETRTADEDVFATSSMVRTAVLLKPRRRIADDIRRLTTESDHRETFGLSEPFKDEYFNSGFLTRNDWSSSLYCELLDEKRRCCICLEIPPNNAKGNLTRSCQRCSAVACKECFGVWLEQKIFAGEATRLCCVACSQPVAHEEVHELVDQRTYVKMKYFITRAEHRACVKQCVWCPRDDCLHLLHSGMGEPLPMETHTLECTQCRTVVCVACHQAEHADVPCTAPRSEMLKASRVHLWKKLNTRQCPSCNSPIYRSGGCKHVR